MNIDIVITLLTPLQVEATLGVMTATLKHSIKPWGDAGYSHGTLVYCTVCDIPDDGSKRRIVLIENFRTILIAALRRRDIKYHSLVAFAETPASCASANFELPSYEGPYRTREVS